MLRRKHFIMRISFLAMLLPGVLLTACKTADEPKRTIGTDISFHELLLPVPRTAQFIDDDYYNWGGSMIRTDDGVCHLFYSRWPRTYSFGHWVSHSEIAYAVADDPLGPYTHVSVALPERGAEYWDGLMTHNPTIHKFGEKYYLYYVGTTGDRALTNGRYHIHRNNQRIGVAVADHPSGPWERFDVPLIDVSPDSTATDALLTTNPAVAKGPDGRYIMAYKAAAIDYTKENLAGPVVHRMAVSDNPTGPFLKLPGLVFHAEGDFFPAEDPYIWYQDDRFLAILKDMQGAFTDVGTSLVLFESFDGIDWKLCPKPLVSKIEVQWEDGSIDKVNKFERPQIYFEDGKPKVLFVAFRYTSDHSWNIHVPLLTDF